MNQTINTEDRRAVMELAAKYWLTEAERGDALKNPAAAQNHMRALLDGKDSEKFIVLYLDTKHRVLASINEFNGTIDGTTVYPRVIVKGAIKHNAAAVIFGHNHPSGSPEPSTADRNITRRLKDALALIDVRVLDHLIVGDSVVSMAERGMV